MPTHTDLRIGMLVRWYGSGGPDCDDDPNDLGIVVKLPAGDWHGYYHIAWTITNTQSHHSAEMIEESLYQQQMEIVPQPRA